VLRSAGNSSSRSSAARSVRSTKPAGTAGPIDGAVVSTALGFHARERDGILKGWRRPRSIEGAATEHRSPAVPSGTVFDAGSELAFLQSEPRSGTACYLAWVFPRCRGVHLLTRPFSSENDENVAPPAAHRQPARGAISAADPPVPRSRGARIGNALARRRRLMAATQRRGAGALASESVPNGSRVEVGAITRGFRALGATTRPDPARIDEGRSRARPRAA